MRSGNTNLWRPSRIVQNKIRPIPLVPEHFSQPTKCFNLNLPDTLAGYTQFSRNLFECLHLVVMQPESTLNNHTLLVVKFTEPLIDMARTALNVSGSMIAGVLTSRYCR